MTSLAKKNSSNSTWKEIRDSRYGLTVAETLARRTVALTEPFRNHVHRMTPIAAQQIENYRKGTALIINVHFTHHGGTYACHALGKAPGQTGSPSFACMGLTDAVPRQREFRLGILRIDPLD